MVFWPDCEGTLECFTVETGAMMVLKWYGVLSGVLLLGYVVVLRVVDHDAG